MCRAKEASRAGPVFMTYLGKTAHVSLSFEAYLQPTRQHQNIANLLAMLSAADIEFETPRTTINTQAASFSCVRSLYKRGA